MSDETEDEFEDLEEGWEITKELLENIKERCESAGISFDDMSTTEDFDIDLRINFPNGKDNRSVALFDQSDLDRFNAIEFESYTLIGSFGAIFNADMGTIEAIITAPIIAKYTYNRLRKLLETDKTVLVSGVEELNLQISFCTSSEEVKVISGLSEDLNLSLLISGPGIDNYEKALKILRDISNSVFFDIDVQNDVLLSLVRSSKRRRVFLKDSAISLEFPKNSYDSAPMDLYWYARSAVSMPLLQFLAYYQAIEYYYPNFHNAEIAKKIRNILKNPSFRISNDSDISRIVSTIKSNTSGFGSEKEQLKTTIKECLTNDEILNFMNMNSRRLEFFNSKAKGITSKLINIQNRNIDLHAQVADRVYDIRCKIVHTKADDVDGEIELLLPFSQEAEKLEEDIELVRFVARKIIICASQNIH